jgi:peptidoglycan/LPS O-acetylase OafA/YrhL
MSSAELKNINYLDTYRGLCCLSVVLSHSFIFFDEVKLVDGIAFGTVNFFLLSSFLLTYRLIAQFERADHTSSLSVVANYFISRFFRIYVPVWIFLLVCWLVELFVLERTEDLNINFENMLALNNVNFTYLDYGNY